MGLPHLLFGCFTPVNLGCVYARVCLHVCSQGIKPPLTRVLYNPPHKANSGFKDCQSPLLICELQLSQCRWTDISCPSLPDPFILSMYHPSFWCYKDHFYCLLKGAFVLLVLNDGWLCLPPCSASFLCPLFSLSLFGLALSCHSQSSLLNLCTALTLGGTQHNTLLPSHPICPPAKGLRPLHRHQCLPLLAGW